MHDIPTTVFISLRSRFFDDLGKPKSFNLRPKQNTQDDPFDEFLANVALSGIDGLECVKASGPLITPDLALFRSALCRGAKPEDLRDDLTRLVAFEVKKLERTPNGTVARASGLDYNTTPPCGRVRIYDDAGVTLDVRGFYIFVCLEAANAGVMVTALAIVDGNILNTDFAFYLSIVGEREKKIELGSYADGADRARPMLIFSNPLGVAQFNKGACLIHPSSDLETKTASTLKRVHLLKRTKKGAIDAEFHVYRTRTDAEGMEVTTLIDPMPTPTRDTKTRPRGRFKLPFRV